MATIPSMRSSKTDWLNFHCHHCSNLITNRFKTIIIGDSIAAGLNRYRSVWTKYLEPLKTLHCDIGGDRVQNVFMAGPEYPNHIKPQKCRYFMRGKQLVPRFT